MEAMEREHCVKYGCDVEFHTQNSKFRTTPKQEWRTVVLNTPNENNGGGRQIRPLEEVMQEQLVRQAGLCKAEVVAVILYTGPMVCSADMHLPPAVPA
jgi:hypothetical protein